MLNLYTGTMHALRAFLMCRILYFRRIEIAAALDLTERQVKAGQATQVKNNMAVEIYI